MNKKSMQKKVQLIIFLKFWSNQLNQAFSAKVSMEMRCYSCILLQTYLTKDHKKLHNDLRYTVITDSRKYTCNM